MNDGPRWRDAEKAALALGEKDRHLMLLLAKLPFLFAEAMLPFSPYPTSAGLYRALVRLRDADLIRTICPSIRPGHSPGLWYLSDLGLSALAIALGVEPPDFARHNKIRRTDLLALLPGLPQLLAAYELLSGLAISLPARPNLITWERPWQRSYWRNTAKAPVTFGLPARATLAWGGETRAFVLVPDLATFPLRLLRVALTHYLRHRLDRQEESTLVVATVDEHRAAAWRSLIEETHRAVAGPPLDVVIVTWCQLPQGLAVAAGRKGSPLTSAPNPCQIPRLLELWSRPPGRLLPRLVGGGSSEPLRQKGVAGRLSHPTLALTAGDRAVLDLVGRHPFLPTEHLTTVFGWELKWARQRRNRLVTGGLLRVLTPAEVGRDIAPLALLELTFAGLRLVAAQQGLSLPVAVRQNGLVGGGPARPIGSRAKLLRQLAHTLSADGVFIGLIRTAREFARAGNDDALLEWRSAAACARRYLRPDGYGLYRHAGRLFGFFLEYDRGTLNGTEYLRKFAGYFDYLESGRYRGDYDGFPTILVVATNNLVEERIARAVRAAAVGRVAKLPLLITWQRLIDDERNPDGLLGPIWRGIDAGLESRRRLQLNPPPGASTKRP